MESFSLDIRVNLLEEKMRHREHSMNTMERRMDRLFEGQIRLAERISELQAHTDARFLDVAGQFDRVHESMARQTRWILSAILFASVMGPIIMKLLDRFL